jgi:hypothetical protein
MHKKCSQSWPKQAIEEQMRRRPTDTVFIRVAVHRDTFYTCFLSVSMLPLLSGVSNQFWTR